MTSVKEHTTLPKEIVKRKMECGRNGEIGACSVSCGRGFRTRYRTCKSHLNIAEIQLNTSICNTHDCPTFPDAYYMEDYTLCFFYPPTNGEWGSWNRDYGGKPDGGDNGLYLYSRSCNSPTPLFCDNVCIGDNLRIRPFNESLILKIASPTVNVPKWNQAIDAMKNYSICGWFWLNITRPKKALNILCIYHEEIENYILVNFKSDYVELRFTDGSSPTIIPVKKDMIAMNEWYHLCISFRSAEFINTFDVFMNGTFIQSYTTKTPKRYFDKNNYLISIGNDIDDKKVNDASQAFIGMLTGWNLYKKYLLPEEILSLYLEVN